MYLCPFLCISHLFPCCLSLPALPLEPYTLFLTSDWAHINFRTLAHIALTVRATYFELGAATVRLIEYIHLLHCARGELRHLDILAVRDI